MSDGTPIARVRADGTVEELGRWLPPERRLELDRPGFPFLRPGSHVLERAVPWLFWDMCPSGFLGARFARSFPELRLPERPTHWSDEHCLRAVSHRGEDLSGNLLIGAESRERFEREYAPAIRSGALKRDDVATLVEELLSSSAWAASSSVGGQRPKVVVHSVGTIDPKDSLLKFTPPLDTPLGQRWNDLLVFESNCAATLLQHGINAVGGSPERYRLFRGRGGLLTNRFDRVGSLGRRGAGTLYFLALSRAQAELSAPEVMTSLHRDGLVSEEDVRLVSRVHAFSAAIGNTDAHLGNYCLLFDDEGRARLSPIYDVTAMVFAPQADELPDARVKPRVAPVQPDVERMLATLVEAVRADDRISSAFRELWLRHVRA